MTAARHPWLVLLIVLLARSGADLQTQRKWQNGIWLDSRDERTYVIFADTFRLHLEDLTPGDRRALVFNVDTAVKFVVEAERVFVLDRNNREHELKLVRRVDLNYSAYGGGHYIKSIAEDGTSLTLEDGSLWEIDPRAYYFTSRWQPLEGITVRKIDPT